MNLSDFNKHREIVRKIYSDSNCKYDGYEYIIHVDMVCDNVKKHKAIFINEYDYIVTLFAALYHDCIEDTKTSYNDISKLTNSVVADITLAVTDVNANNRLMKHLLTMHKTVGDYRAIILKMCDILANANYSKSLGSSMYKKYVTEYAYRKPIFQLALMWYKEYLNQDELDILWKKLDVVHEKHVGVISSNIIDFNLWKKEHYSNGKNIDTQKKFVADNITYYCISNILDLHSLTLDEIIETGYAKENSEYEKILFFININHIKK